MKQVGPGADRFTVRRSTGGDYRIFTVTSGSVVSISGITISGGNVPGGSGGGINNGGALTISGSTISENSAGNGGGPTNGRLTLNSDGSFTYTPNAHFNGEDSFTYEATDGKEVSNTATVSISVTAVNDAPTVTVDGGGSCGAASDMRGTINLALSDPDDPPQSLTLTATSSNRSVLPNSNISFGGGTDASRTMTVSSLTGSGTSNVTIRVSDEGDLEGTVLVRVISGSASNNILTGSANAEMIFARKGSDTVSAQGANDLLCGGNGNDKLTGGLGADRFGGGSGTDTATDFDEGQGDTKAGIP
jgi:VCBS repeat-containing protein